MVIGVIGPSLMRCPKLIDLFRRVPMAAKGHISSKQAARLTRRKLPQAEIKTVCDDFKVIHAEFQFEVLKLSSTRHLRLQYRA